VRCGIVLAHGNPSVIPRPTDGEAGGGFFIVAKTAYNAVYERFWPLQQSKERQLLLNDYRCYL
jgi:hypothetical protein